MFFYTVYKSQQKDPQTSQRKNDSVAPGWGRVVPVRRPTKLELKHFRDGDEHHVLSFLNVPFETNSRVPLASFFPDTTRTQVWPFLPSCRLLPGLVYHYDSTTKKEYFLFGPHAHEHHSPSYQEYRVSILDMLSVATVGLRYHAENCVRMEGLTSSPSSFPYDQYYFVYGQLVQVLLFWRYYSLPDAPFLERLIRVNNDRNDFRVDHKKGDPFVVRKAGEPLSVVDTSNSLTYKDKGDASTRFLPPYLLKNEPPIIYYYKRYFKNSQVVGTHARSLGGGDGVRSSLTPNTLSSLVHDFSVGTYDVLTTNRLTDISYWLTIIHTLLLDVSYEHREDFKVYSKMMEHLASLKTAFTVLQG